MKNSNVATDGSTAAFLKASQALQARSNGVTDSRLLVSFLYELLRDHMPAGEVEKIMLHVGLEEPPMHYSNGYLAMYAQDLANRLVRDDRSEIDTHVEVSQRV